MKKLVQLKFVQLFYLIGRNKNDQKNVLLKVFTTWIRSAQIFLDPIQKRAPAKSVQLEAVYLEALLYLASW